MLRNRWILKLFAVAALAVGFSTTANAQMQVRPALIELQLDEGRPSGIFNVSNTSDTEQRFRVKAVAFTFTEDGAIEPPEGEAPFDLSKMIKFNPKEFSIPPNSTRAVRFTVVQRGELEVGEHWAALAFEPLKTRRASAEDDGRSYDVEVSTALIVPVYGWVKERNYSAEIKNIEAFTGPDDQVFIEAVMANTGTGYLLAEGSYEIVNKSGDVVASGLIGRDFVLRESNRNWRARVTDVAPSDDLTVRIKIRTGQMEEVLAAETPLVVGPAGK